MKRASWFIRAAAAAALLVPATGHAYVLWTGPGDTAPANPAAFARAVGDVKGPVDDIRDGKKGPPASGDRMVMLWGPAKGDSFAGMNAEKLAAFIANWKMLNTKLETFELVTEDMRGPSGAFDLESYAKDVNKVLARKKTKVALKALPVGPKKVVWSKLVVSVDGKTFCHVLSESSSGVESALPDPKADLNVACQAKDFPKMYQDKAIAKVSGQLSGLRNFLAATK